MKIKTFKNIISFNRVRFVNEIESLGYSVKREHDNYLLKPKSFTKILTTGGLIFSLEAVKLTLRDDSIVVDFIINKLYFSILTLCALIICIFMIYSVPSFSPAKIVIMFSVLLIVSFVLMFFLLRSDILRDIKSAF